MPSDPWEKSMLRAWLVVGGILWMIIILVVIFAW